MKLKALPEMRGPGSLSLCGEDKPSYIDQTSFYQLTNGFSASSISFNVQ